MQNKEIITYELPICNITGSEAIHISHEMTANLKFHQFIPSNIGIEYLHITQNHVSNHLCIITQIGEHKLNRSLILTVVYEGGLVFVENEEFNIWGEGNSLEEATESFEDFFLYDLELYKNTPLESMDFFARQNYKLYESIIDIS